MTHTSWPPDSRPYNIIHRARLVCWLSHQVTPPIQRQYRLSYLKPAMSSLLPLHPLNIQFLQVGKSVQLQSKPVIVAFDHSLASFRFLCALLQTCFADLEAGVHQHWDRLTPEQLISWLSKDDHLFWYSKPDEDSLCPRYDIIKRQDCRLLFSGYQYWDQHPCLAMTQSPRVQCLTRGLTLAQKWVTGFRGRISTPPLPPTCSKRQVTASDS